MFCIVNADDIIENIIVADEVFAKAVGGLEYYDGASIGEKYDPLKYSLNDKQKIQNLEVENNLLKAQIQAQSKSHDFLEDCVAEMAQIVYAN